MPWRIVEDAEALHALADHVMRAVGRGDVAQDVGDGADAVELVRAGIVHRRVALHHDADRALLAHRLLERRDRLGPAHRDRDDHAGEEHGVADREQDQGVVRQRDRRTLTFRLDLGRRALRRGALQELHGLPASLSFSSVNTRQP